MKLEAGEAMMLCMHDFVSRQRERLLHAFFHFHLVIVEVKVEVEVSS